MKNTLKKTSRDKGWEIKPMLDFDTRRNFINVCHDELERRRTVDIKALSERCLVSRLQQNLSLRRFRWPTHPLPAVPHP